MGVDAAVPATELRACLRKNRFVLLQSFAGRLICCGPDIPAGYVADVTEHAPVVAGAVLSPARDRDILPAAVSAARVRDHHVVSAIRHQLHLWYRRVGAAENADRRF